MRTPLLLLGIGACAAPAAAPAAPAPKITRFATEVVTFAPEEASEVLRGPFLVTTINPGSDLRLAVAKTTCDGATWFAYSGGGVAVGDGELLCAWSLARQPAIHAFSGHD